MNTEDYETILMLAGGCSLDSSPKKNWVERSGGLPNYICRVARGIMRSGKSKSSAIAIAVSQVKKWAAGIGDVDADTRAKAAKAVAAWEALKAKNKSKKVVSASYVTNDGEEGSYLMLSDIPSFKTDIVRMAWDSVERERRDEWNRTHARVSSTSDMTEAPESYYPYKWLKELWTDFIIVESEDDGKVEVEKVPYTVNPLTQEVTFGDPIEVRQVFIEMDEDLTDNEKELLKDLIGE